MQWLKKEKYFIALLFIAAVFIFTGLNRSYLWEDEAETAVIAKNLLHTGLPTSYDGKNIVTQEWGHDSNTQHIWIHQPWLAHYTAALSFKLLGMTTRSARFPFALCAFLAIVLFYKKLLHNRELPGTALLASLFLTFSATFLLHAGQCRYYGLLMLITVLWLFSYWDFKTKKTAWFIPAVIGALLFNTQYLNAVALFGATGITLFFLQKYSKAEWLQECKLWLTVAILCLPWILYSEVFTKLQESTVSGFTRLLTIPVMWLFNVITLNHFIFPVIILFVWCYWLWKKQLSLFEKYCLFSLCLYLIFIAANPLYPDIRYLLPLLFPASYLLAKTVIRLKNKSIIWQTFLIVSLIATNIWSMPFWLATKPLLPEKLQKHYQNLRFDFPQYVYELFGNKRYVGPVQATVTYLQKHATENQTLFVSYEAEPYIFYTKLKLLRTLPFPTAPDFIILRGDEWYTWLKWTLTKDALTQQTYPYIWNYHPEKDSPAVQQIRKKYIEDYIHKHHYKKIILNAPNELWENRPSLLWHIFLPRQTYMPIAIYSRHGM